MKIEELEKELGLEEGCKTYKGDCHDCGRHVEVTAKRADDGSMIIEGGAIFLIHKAQEKRHFFKCDTCFKKDKTLRYYEKCEVYSRAVGYLRPVNQWNKGKQEEFKHRVLFKNTEGD